MWLKSSYANSKLASVCKKLRSWQCCVPNLTTTLMKTSISFIIHSYEKTREVFDDYFIDIKKAKSKLNRVLRKPFFSASLRAKNTLKTENLVFNIKEISIEELCYLYPKRVRSLFAKLDLEGQGR